MSELQEILAQFKVSVEDWKRTVEKYPLEDLLKKPDEDSWSIAQVCTHLLMAHEKFFLRNAIKCIENRATETRKGRNFISKIILWFGTFPPIRVRMPKSVSVQPPQPESKEELFEGFDEAVKKMEETIARIPDSNQNMRNKHPLLGMLNAQDWLKADEMHFRHHFRQRKRLEKFLKKGK